MRRRMLMLLFSLALLANVAIMPGRAQDKMPDDKMAGDKMAKKNSKKKKKDKMDKMDKMDKQDGKM